MSATAPMAVLEENIQAFEGLRQKLIQQIAYEEMRSQPDQALLRRLKSESLNLKDTLKQAKDQAMQKPQPDLSAA